MLTTQIPTKDAERTVFGALQVRSLLDDPALRECLGVTDGTGERPTRPANIRQLLELAAA